MPRYFFDVIDGERQVDDEGTCLPDEETARIEAVRFGAAFVRDHPHALIARGAWRVEAYDERGRYLFVVAVTFALPQHDGASWFKARQSSSA